MTDDVRKRVTDPRHVAAFAEMSRDAAAEAMRQDNPAMTDEEVAAILEHAPGRAVLWAQARITSGVATTEDELAALRRRLPGAANQGGRRSRHAARVDAMLRAAAALPEGADTRERVAVQLGRVRRQDGDPTDEPTSAFKDDVSKAGGWVEIQRRAAILRNR